MFEVGFSELLVIFVLALIVLGPEKLPRSRNRSAAGSGGRARWRSSSAISSKKK